MKNNSHKDQILEGSRAIALTVNNIRPQVVSAYPITPQTHIVEDLAQFKADGKADYEYVRAESEFAAASIVEGASAQGTRVYSATCSQGLLLMAEVLFNIAGMRLPVVITCANRGVSAPITIWNDHQDAMTIRDAGWMMFFAENHQEAVEQHLLAYKMAEKTNIPAVVNIDGFVLTHSYEPVAIPDVKKIKKFLPDYKPRKNMELNPDSPVTMGSFAPPAHYMEIRQQLQNDLINSTSTIKKEYEHYLQIFGTDNKKTKSRIDNGLMEYYGPQSPKTLIVAMGSVAGTIKQTVDESRKKVGVLKLKTFRPFPGEEIKKTVKKLNPKHIAVVDKSISLGQMGPLASEIRTAFQAPIPNMKASRYHPHIKSFIAGLGGRDITRDKVKNIIKLAEEKDKNNHHGIFIN